MTSLWDPRQVLDVYPERCGFTCVGTTKQGQRCRNSFISRSSLIEASKILHDMHNMNIHQGGFMEQISPKLDRLAEMTLCPRWHRDHKYGNCQRPQVHYKWINLVSAQRNYLLGCRAYGQNAVYPPAPIQPTIPFPPSNIYTLPMPNMTAVTYSHPSGFLAGGSQPAPAIGLANSHYVAQPATPNYYQSIIQSQPPAPIPQTPALSIQTPNPTGMPLSSNPSLTASELDTDSNPSFNDSGYTTDHTTTSDFVLPLNGPATVFPSPPSSIWSMTPPSPTRSSSDSLSSSSPSGNETPVSSPSLIQSARSSRSSNSSRSRFSTSTPSAAFTNALTTALATALAATPSLPVERSASIGGSSNSRLSRRISNRSSTNPNPLATVLATTLATVLTEHLTAALTREIAQFDGLAVLAPLLQSALGFEAPSSRSSRRSDRSTRSPSTTPETPLVAQAAAQMLGHQASASQVSSPSTPIPQPQSPPSPPAQTALSQASSSSAPPPPPPVARRPITDPCYVCLLPIDDPDDAEWCRASCGQNLHTECFENWAESQSNSGRVVNCAFCRSAWM